ncbi:DUF6300 family protein [Streptomyces sp. NBC_01643]|uniref:DUF6300 family protein n=1 Tax=Streptomyces sp. NBC_01643 TaxID=2975906 RepID=UPI00386B5CEF
MREATLCPVCDRDEPAADKLLAFFAVHKTLEPSELETFHIGHRLSLDPPKGFESGLSIGFGSGGRVRAGCVRWSAQLFHGSVPVGPLRAGRAGAVRISRPVRGRWGTGVSRRVARASCAAGAG